MSSLPGWARRGRSGWRHTGQERPDFAVAPRPGQESVWDYPRPPRLEPDSRRVVVRLGEVIVADTSESVRLLETASPPTFYLPPEAVRGELLEAAPGVSRCEWKGEARYYTLVLGDRRLERVAWGYEAPFPELATLRGWFSFYPTPLECTVGGEAVRPQPGGFYGGWITPELVGPFKGEPGSEGW